MSQSLEKLRNLCVLESVSIKHYTFRDFGRSHTLLLRLLDAERLACPSVEKVNKPTGQRAGGARARQTL